MRTIVRNRLRGVTLVEVVVVLTIVAVLLTVFIATLRGTESGDYISRGTQQIYDDLILIRSRALSTNADHRMTFQNVTSWKIQQYDTDTATWTDIGDIRNMPSDTYLAALPSIVITATPRGMFLNALGSSSAFVTITGLGAARTKSIYIFPGGAIELKTP
ncbi:MAG: prepilin-type N-terminal cleavage/methylation domain-containing protein [Pseudomonadota bacterium]